MAPAVRPPVDTRGEEAQVEEADGPQEVGVCWGCFRSTAGDNRMMPFTRAVNVVGSCPMEVGT